MIMSGFEVADQLRLLLGLAAGHRDHRCAQTFCTVVRAQPSRKQTIAIRYVNFVFCAAASGAQGTRHDVRPGIDIVWV